MVFLRMVGGAAMDTCATSQSKTFDSRMCSYLCILTPGEGDTTMFEVLG